MQLFNIQRIYVLSDLKLINSHNHNLNNAYKENREVSMYIFSIF